MRVPKNYSKDNCITHSQPTSLILFTWFHLLNETDILSKVQKLDNLKSHDFLTHMFPMERM